MKDWLETELAGALGQLKHSDEFAHVKFNQGRIQTLERLKEFIANGYQEFDY